jgi:hypothetical protein
MTRPGTYLSVVLAAGSVAVGALFEADAVAGGSLFNAESGARTAAERVAIVIDASLARDGRHHVDPRLGDVDSEVRLPGDADEARTNVRYFDALGYRLVVAGPRAEAAADSVGVDALHVPDLPGALRAAR